jgi:hypothetical protein
MYLKFVSEEWKPKQDFSPICCCGARAQADALALLWIIRLIINTIQAHQFARGQNWYPVFLESDSVNKARTVARLPQSTPAYDYIGNYMSMSAQMLRAHASAKTLSSSLAVSDKPPLPGTTSMVFWARS